MRQSKKVESLRDFKNRIARMLGSTPEVKPRKNKLLVRKPTDRGYYPPKRKATIEGQ